MPEKLKQWPNNIELDNNPTNNVTNEVSENVEKLTNKHVTITIDEIAKALNKEKVKKTLPNKKIIETIDWKPEELTNVYKFINKYKDDNSLWINDLVTIDWWAPTWLVPVISHAFHPVSTSINYPQWNTILPLNWVIVSEKWEWDNLSFNIEDKWDYTLVEFKLDQPAIDLEKTMQTLVAPSIEIGKPVIISGRWPVSIATWLAEAYSHIVPFVANFQPWTWNVVSISHDIDNPLGKIID